MTKLRYSPDLALPLDAVTQRFAFLGRIGSGKTYGATKLAELMLDAGAQVVALDPVGLWYGLRVAGNGAGYSLPVFGGLHGDVPLEAGAGALMADLIVDRGLSCVLDVSQFESDASKARFAETFAKRFFFRKKAAPSAVHIFLEECQEFVPQNPQQKENDMLHEWTRMAKLGRNFGIGLSLISQRPQEVNKKVLNLTECLVAFQMTGAHERKAIREWIASVGADENILNVLPSLAVGVAHVYSPQWLRISKQIKAAPKRSADVSSTPQVGASAVEAKPLTKVDLAALRDVMAATIEKAKAEDPKELRKEIARLRNSATVAAPVVDERAIERAVAAERKACDARLAPVLRAMGRAANIMMSTGNALLDEGAKVVTAIEVYEATAGERVSTQAGHYNAPVPANTGPLASPSRPSPRAVRAAPVDGAKVGRTGARAWDVLAAIHDGRFTIPALYDRWVTCDRDVNALRRAMERVDLEPMVETFLEAAHCSEDTKAHYRALLRRFFAEGEPFDAADFTVGRVQRFIDELTVKPGTTRKAGAALRTFANWLVRRGVLAANPVREIQLPSAPAARTLFLDTPDAQLLADAQASPYRELSALLAGSGVEVSVALRLRRRDVDARKKEVRAAGTKTHARDRVVRVADWAWPYVLRAMREKKADALLFDTIPNRWTAGDVHRLAAEALAKESPVFAGYTMRDARHTYAVRQIRAGVPVEVVARQLGHANSTLVQTVYGRFVPSQDERAKWERVAAAAEKARAKESKQSTGDADHAAVAPSQSTPN